MGERSKHSYSIGDRVRVLLDRIDTEQRKLQFASSQEERKPVKKAAPAQERSVQGAPQSKPKSEKQQKREKKQKKKDHKKNKRRDF